MKFIGPGWKPGYLRQTDRQGRAQPLSFSSLWSFPQDLIKFWMERYLISLGSRDAISQEQIHIRRQSAVLAVATFSSHLQKSTFSGVCCTFPKHTHAHTHKICIWKKIKERKEAARCCQNRSVPWKILCESPSFPALETLWLSTLLNYLLLLYSLPPPAYPLYRQNGDSS